MVFIGSVGFCSSLVAYLLIAFNVKNSQQMGQETEGFLLWSEIIAIATIFKVGPSSSS